MRTNGETGALRLVRIAPPFDDNKENPMNANHVAFEVPEGRTRHDALATGSVLGAMLLSALAGAFVIAVDPAPTTAADLSVNYAAIEEAQ